MNNIIKLDALRLENPSSNSTTIQCVICQEIPLNPKECINCQNIFCEDCLAIWIEIKNICPCFCSESPLQTKQAHKFVRDIICNLKVKCSNYEKGCKEILRYENLMNHEKNYCLFTLIKCPKGFCKEEIFFKDRELHISKCFFEEIECAICKLKFQKIEFPKHQCIVKLFEEMEVLEEKCRRNDQKINVMDAEIESFVGENHKKKIEFDSILEKMVKSKVKDLKIYMKNEVEATLQDLLNKNPHEGKPIKNKKNEAVFEDFDEKPGFASKFFESFKNQSPNNSVDEKTILDEKIIPGDEKKVKKKNENKSLNNSGEEEESKHSLHNKICHEKYENLNWMIDPERLKCGICSQIRLIRYKCKLCLKNLCVKCKRPKFKKKICPVLHPLFKIKTKEDLDCDICSENIKKGDFCYKDEFCCADVCLVCMEKEE